MSTRVVLFGAIAGCIAGVALTWLVRRVARALNIVNHPNPIVPQHREPVAYLGGLAVGLAIVVAAIAGARFADMPSAFHVPFRIAVPAVLFLLIGTIDDLRPLSPLLKLVLQGIASASAVALGLVWRVSGIDALDIVVSFAWFVVLVNAFNVTDVCDGLVAGLAVIALVLAELRGAETALPLLAAGALLGFLVFNRPPATIFLGDGGSHLLGFLVGASLIAAPRATASWKELIAVVLAVGVVLFEIALLVYARVRKGIPWWRGSPDHFSLRLQARGLSRLQTDMLAWSAMTLLCAIAFVLPRLPDAVAALAVVGTIAAFVPAWKLLLQVRS